MSQVQQEAIRAVSAAISAGEGNLLSSIDTAQDKWQDELVAAKATARTMLANVLSERESLRNSLSTAAELWRVLKPTDHAAPPLTDLAAAAAHRSAEPPKPDHTANAKPQPDLHQQHRATSNPAANTVITTTSTTTTATATSAPQPEPALQEQQQTARSRPTAQKEELPLAPAMDALQIHSRPKLATTNQMAMVRALQNVSHTISLVEFIMSAPAALERAHASLTKIQDDGLHRVIAGNAALLVDSHAILTAVERLRDLVLLDAPHAIQRAASPSVLFAPASATRALLEDIVVRSIFADVLALSQTNPCLLVAAARVVEAEETEDRWWALHLQRCASPHLAPEVRPYGAHRYKRRALDAVVDSLQAIFRQKEADLGFFSDQSNTENNNNNNKSNDPRARPHARDPHVRDTLSSPMEVRNVLDWIEHRRTEVETVRRFVIPCLPPSFGVAELYEKELHKQFMRLVTRLMQLVRPDGSMLLAEQDVILLTSWYTRYKGEVGDHDEAIDSFLNDDDRARLIAALQKHCSQRISERVSAALEYDRKAESAFPEESALASDQLGSRVIRERGAAVRRSDLPDTVFACISEHMKRMLALHVQGLDLAVAQTIGECLTAFQSDVHYAIADRSGSASDEQHGLYVCRTANNMARCLELAEDLRDVFMPMAAEQYRALIEEQMEGVIEGFRSTASMALQTLLQAMTESLGVHASRFYAPHTGTEIMLDVVATLEDHFSEYEMHLLPYHFEQLSMEALKRVVVWYLAPFLRLSDVRLDEDMARRFTSLPTFDDVTMGTEIVCEDSEVGDIMSRRSENDRVDRASSKGLCSLNGDAVVAQIDKDVSNLTRLMKRKVVSYQKKQLQPALEPVQAVRSLYVCDPTTFALVDAFRDARAVVARALRPHWVSECGVDVQLTPRVAELIWERRRDINPVVLLEAVTTIRTSGERLESVSPSRMSSYDDGRMWGSRNSDLGGAFGERSAAARESAVAAEQAAGSSSLLWAPSPSKSSRSRRARGGFA